MTCFAGRLSRLKGSFDNGTSYINIGGVVDLTLNGNVDELECTTHDDTVRTYIPNFSDWTMDASMRWDETDEGQTQLLYTVFPSTTTFKVMFMMQDATGRRTFEADAFITSYSPTGPLDDTSGLDISMRLSNVVIGLVA